ncbi:E3 ubiquitin-protein ligase ATL42-like [Cornus florida]|uniref:E3 ubiquitin-protein ligase ATL42-like n=1 Tax=Cornus florida TaxID=4283 RepID=UPI0028A20B13|nr:E3 ubiquitin-protein ligase ATL42-like [Cornus florida]
MNQLGVFILLFLFFFHVKAQSPSSEEDVPSQQATTFQPSIKVVFGVLCVMFALTFILLVFAKFCHGSSSVDNNRQIRDGLTQSRSRFSGLDKGVIESLPFFRFSSLKGSREGLECVVCLSKFEDTEILRLLPKCKHAFHINCVDQWLEKHSSCPLCRVKVSADDLAYFAYSTSLRYLWEQSERREDSNMELFVQREEDHHGSSRFSIGSSFRKSDKGKKEEELPIQVDCDSDENEKALHKFNHRIIMSDVVLKNRWSSVSSSDLMLLNSEMLNAMSSNRFSSLDINNDQIATASGVEGTEILKIKEETERKRLFESRVSEISQTDSLSSSDLPNTSESKMYQSQTSRFLNPNAERSMSEITVHPRFTELSMRNSNRDTSLPENNAKEERLRRLWLPIARRTVQWFANREERTQQSHNTRHPLNV